jgi:hypothetical protein
MSQLHFGLKLESWNKICLSFQLNTRFGHCGWSSQYLTQLRRAQLCKIDFMYVILSWWWLLAYAKIRLVKGNLECTSMPRSEHGGCKSKVCFSSIKTKWNWLKLPQEALPTVDQPRKTEDKYLIKFKREVNRNVVDPIQQRWNRISEFMHVHSSELISRTQRLRTGLGERRSISRWMN